MRVSAVGVVPPICQGTLITPRLILTAYHCMAMWRDMRIEFGVEPADFVGVPVIGCAAFPGARADGRTADCRDRDTSRAAGERDVAVLVLERRVDPDHGADAILALPAGVVLADSATRSWHGEPIRYVGRDRAHIVDVRSFVDTEVIGTWGALIHVGATGEPGDSGGPTFLADPNIDLERPLVLGVHRSETRPTAWDTRLTDPAIAAWLEPLLTGTVEGVYVGPVDVPPVGHPDRLPAHEAVDPDGDGLVGAHDNCPFVYNPDQRDANADGVGFACDRDEDGVVDEDDNCLHVPNPLQEDCGDDGVGDACSDVDGDGLVDCNDNCPFTYNPSQEVCNRDLPQLDPSNGRPMGVACAPTPCAYVDPLTTGTTDLLRRSTELRNDGIEGRGFVTHLADRTRTVRAGCEVAERVPTGEGSGSVTTGFRWCPCDTATNTAPDRRTCEITAGCGLGADFYEVEPDPTERTWRRMSIVFRGVGGVGDTADTNYGAFPTETRTAVDVGGPASTCTAADLVASTTHTVLRPSLAGRWDFEGDAAREGVPLLESGAPPFAVDRGLRAVNWAHSVRYRGCTTPPCRGSGGTAPGSDAPLASRGAGSDEASHYWSGHTGVRQFTSGREPDIIPFFTARIPFPEICWYCASSFPSLTLGHRPCGPNGCAPRWLARGQGIDVPANDLLTEATHVALTQLGLTWVAARELDGQLARDALLAVGLDGGRQVVAQLAITDAGTIGLVEEKGDPLPPPQDVIALAAPDIVFPRAARGGREVERPCGEGGATLLVGNQHLLIGLGGEGSGAERITFTALRTGQVRSVLLRGAQPGRVLAAAMHVSRLEALLLAELEEPPPALAERSGGPGPRPRGGWPVFARFLHVDLAAGTSRELARFPRLRAFDRHALVGTADGRYALAATNERAGHTWVFGLAVDPRGLHLRGATRLDGRLRGTPTASERGVTLPLERARVGVAWEPVGVRPSDLGADPAISLGAAM